MTISICIPTCQTADEIAPLMNCLEGFCENHEVYASCKKQSAAANRNDCLDNTSGEIVLMVDDDIAAFYQGWVEDMIAPLNDPSVLITSARLLNPDGSQGLMMYQGNSHGDLSDVPRVPTAAIAFRRNNLRFFDDVEAQKAGYPEGYQLSGFEDDSFVAEMQELNPRGRIVINNKCHLIHINEKKGQGQAWDKNFKLFHSIWDESPDGTKRTRKRVYFSEYGEDRWANENIFKGKRGGTFFEAGAIDGIICSNSLFFERSLGWTGLCVEANLARFAELKRNRSCKVDNRGLWDSECKKEFLAVEGGLTGWGGITETIESEHGARIEKNISKGDRYKITVSCTTLADMLRKHELSKVDFLTLDIEGAEFRVLKAFPFKEFDIEVFCIENNFGTYPIELLMNSNDYVKVAELGVSEIYRKRPSVRHTRGNVGGYWNIPRIMNYIWLGGELPEFAKANIAEFKALNPDFEVRMCGESDLDPMFAEAYKKIGSVGRVQASRSDLIRLSVLNKDGGWFNDCDIWPLVSIKEMCAEMELPNGKMPLFVRHDNELAANGFLGCRRGDPGLTKIIEITLEHMEHPAFKTAAPGYWDYGIWNTSEAFKRHPELFFRVDLSKIHACYSTDPEKCRKNVMAILASEERIKEVKEIGGWAIHYAMYSTTEVPDIWPVRKWREKT
ncbi:MAG: FkbM family methyltransferase [Thiothrix sp.]|uniref:FkbM family methyltransferase n=1 Tax=Thiothrix sp. TaxID=1032 RepID=UPI0026034D1D|nr:FkbM family methyltransferase [Thiothrix sp.]MDD5394916.1 FkbM family methyltransferase [Thiothrix sp.]